MAGSVQDVLVPTLSFVTTDLFPQSHPPQIRLVMGLSAPTTVLALAAIYYVCIWFYSLRNQKTPPGPRRRWITGNLYDLPKKKLWLQAKEWGNTFGPVVYIKVFNTSILILNSYKVAVDLLEARSSIYSERKKHWMFFLAGRKYSIFRTSFSEQRFKVLRRFLQDGLNPRTVKTYQPIQLCENIVFINALVDSPQDFRAHIRRNVIAVIIKVTYGLQVGGNDDRIVGLLEEKFELGKQLSIPRKFWVEFLPFLRFIPSWFPGAGFKRYAESVGKELSQLETIPFEMGIKRILSGDYIESFMSNHLVEENVLSQDPVKHEYIKWSCEALYAAGGDTTVSALATFFYVMAMHPDVQHKVQADIDQLTPNRLPTFEDYDSLPYMKAIIKEVIRWGAPVPLGLPHCLLKDDVYEDYFIPEGTTAIANIWAMAHDEEMYPDPWKFDPSRHLGDSPQLDPFNFIFGFGRRVCPGILLAELSLFFNMSRILALFNISKPIDEHGNETEQKIEWSNGVISHIEHFDCRISPRSEKHLALLKQESDP